MTNKVLELIKQNEAKWVDLRFTDIRGKEQHVSFPAYSVGEDTFVQGKMFDGSSLAGWKGIEASDMILMPSRNRVRYFWPHTECAVAAKRLSADWPKSV